MNKIIYSAIIALSLLVSGALAQGQGQAQGQNENVNVFVVGSATTGPNGPPGESGEFFG
jgi:ABC-type molybdate transport system substrate-binding protein